MTGKGVPCVRILVVDDEKPCLDELVYLLSRQDGVILAGAFTDPVEAMTASADLMPDAAFLDLSMPRMNGADLAKKMIESSPGLKVAFVTAHAKELAKLGENPALGSLLKPVSEARLQLLLQRLQG